MRKTTPMKLGDLWDDFLKSNSGVARKLAEARVSEVWPKVVGPSVASQTVSLSVEKGILTARFSSSGVRSEIFRRRDALRDAVNRALGLDVLRTVIVK